MRIIEMNRATDPREKTSADQLQTSLQEENVDQTNDLEVEDDVEEDLGMEQEEADEEE